MDNGKTYEVFRNFNKKNPQIYNESGEDISKEYSVNKTTGNMFFVEQTKIDEEIFLSTLVSQQQEVRLDRQTQNFLIQKVANLAGTGDDNVSYKKAIEKLNKKQVEEIGTDRSQGRPINIVQEEKKNAEKEKENLICYKDKKYEMEKEQNKLEEKINKEELNFEIIKEIKKINEKEKLEKEKINISEKIKINNENKLEELEKEKNKIENIIKNKLEEIQLKEIIQTKRGQGYLLKEENECH